MLIALTRGISSNLGECELQELDRQPIDIRRAIEQHRSYERCLEELGAQLISLPADPQYPDGVFVEDPAIVLDEIAVIARMGAESRGGEAAPIAEKLARFRPLLFLQPPGTLEGGDVMRAGKTLYVGLSRRTNAQGIAELAEVTSQFGYKVVPVPVRGCLHLKSACCYLGGETIIANRSWIDAGIFGGFRVVDVPAEEPRGGNVLRVGDTLILPEAFPRTRESLERSGFRVRTVDASELAKAEGGVTCTSILFEG
ncbi:MAG TPA: arginine deiminase family protein [Bryobacteraceae bacterium]|nr:arginine deiminase family protein [Bryobacteraceae bacterium]